jgi:hypothetical protein
MWPENCRASLDPFVVTLLKELGIKLIDDNRQWFFGRAVQLIHSGLLPARSGLELEYRSGDGLSTIAGCLAKQVFGYPGIGLGSGAVELSSIQGAKPLGFDVQNLGDIRFRDTKPGHCLDLAAPALVSDVHNESYDPDYSPVSISPPRSWRGSDPLLCS